MRDTTLCHPSPSSSKPEGHTVFVDALSFLKQSRTKVRVTGSRFLHYFPWLRTQMWL